MCDTDPCDACSGRPAEDDCGNDQDMQRFFVVRESKGKWWQLHSVLEHGVYTKVGRLIGYPRPQVAQCGLIVKMALVAASGL